MLREERVAALREAKRRQDEEVEKIEDFISRFRYKADKAALVQSRIKQLEKVERIVLPPERKKIRFSFPDPPKSGRMVVELSGVKKAYGAKVVLDGIDLAIEKGERIALVGHNGAGKSTLIGILSTLIRPSSGSITWSPAPALPRAEIGVLAHEAMVYGELTAEENLHFWGSLHDVADLDRRSSALLDEVGLDERARKRTARTFSRGMMQRLALARALLADPRVLLFDEPFTGLDRDGAATLSRVLRREKERGRLILVATHDLEAVAGICDHLVVLRNGKIVLDELSAGAFSLAELKSRYEAAA